MATNDEIVMDIDEDFLEETNVKVLNDYHEKTGKPVYIHTYPDNLALVFPKVETYGNSGNREQDLIDKAACIMAVIPWAQAFDDGNRRTSITAAGTFLNDNGYDIGIDTKNENKELRELLQEIKKHRRDLEPNLMKQLILYISERIRKYESKT